MKTTPVCTNGGSARRGETMPEQAAKPKPSRRIRSLIKRAFTLQERGKKLFEKSRDSLKLAMNNGLAVGQSVEIEISGEDGSKKTEVFAIKDNFAGEVAFKRSYVSHYELEIVPKYKRQSKPESQSVVAGESHE
ncbi:MAG TPA: hypothetical protein VFA58_01755 [Chthoniobacterales bacterium]|nr:hypothetical protein [Chthoniobacterales bacterium]